VNPQLRREIVLDNLIITILMKNIWFKFLSILTIELLKKEKKISLLISFLLSYQ